MLTNWSIKKLLQFWAVVTVVVVVIMAVMSNYANTLFGSTQQVFSDQLLPLENSSQKLHSVVSELSNRQKQILTSETASQLEQYTERGVLEQRFLQHWLRLSTIPRIEPDIESIPQTLFDYYQDFLQLDDEVLEFKTASLLLADALMAQRDDIEQHIDSVVRQLTTVEMPSGLTQQSALMMLLKNIELDLQALKAISFQSYTMSSDDQLTRLNTQHILPLFARLTANLQRLQRQLPAATQMLQNVTALHGLFVGDDGLIHLHSQRLLIHALLTQSENSAIAVMRIMMEKLDQLALVIHQQSYKTVAKNVDAANTARWQIVVLSMFITLGMVAFSYLLFRSINKPISTIRQSMHALSEGRFETRMQEADSENEVSLLAHDFNRFAQRTEQLIADVEEAKSSQQQSAKQIRTILNAVPEAILTVDNDGCIRESNPAAESVLGGDKSRLVGEHLSVFIDEITAGIALIDMADDLRTGKEFVGRRLDGELLYLLLSLNPIVTEDSVVWVCVISDVTARKQIDYQLRKTSQELDVIFENAMVGIALVRDREFVRINQKFEQLFEYARDDIIGASTLCIYPNERSFTVFGEQAYQTLYIGGNYEAQIEMRRSSGQLFWCAISGKALNPSDPSEGSIWLFEDVTKQREVEERLIRLASSDVLTGLPNRHVFTDRVEHAIHRAQRDTGRLAVFFLDLDHFKHINDSLGHRAGDNLLCEVAKRIRSCLREGDTVARLGGDEFTVLLEEVRSAEYVGKVAEKVLLAMSQPYEIENKRINVSPSIGISLFPADGRDVDMLIRNADAAMYHAKKQGRNNFQFYSVEMNAEATLRLELETALRQAVEERQFTLHYQPQIDIRSGQLIGAEVLLRWNTEKWGNVSPSKFVPILEDTGLIAEVGEWVLNQACAAFADWQPELPEEFRIAVNLSGRQFKDGRVLTQVRRLLQQYGMSANNLELEITESILMEDTMLATTVLTQLSEMGVSLAIDDFGTGYSSLSYLKQFPLNVLKIDSSFIRDISHDQDDEAIVDAIVALSSSLGLRVIAEGVESLDQLEFLRAHQCCCAQGYYFSGPVDKAHFGQLLHQSWLS